MLDNHPAAQFVRAFHGDLTRWFSGTEDRERVWQRIEDGTPLDMVLVYPSGQRLTGATFLQSIRELHASSPGFVASISNMEVIHADPDLAIVAYVESQTGAQRSAGKNQRSALAVLRREGERWVWKFIQETALPTGT